MNILDKKTPKLKRKLIQAIEKRKTEMVYGSKSTLGLVWVWQQKGRLLTYSYLHKVKYADKQRRNCERWGKTWQWAGDEDIYIPRPRYQVLYFYILLLSLTSTVDMRCSNLKENKNIYIIIQRYVVSVLTKNNNYRV